jgi:hypothetical protein
MRDNEKLLYEALENAVADKKFMGNDTKVDKAIEALTPKSTITATFKRLQGNALSDFLVKQRGGVLGFTAENEAAKIREYVKRTFQVHMDDAKTSEEAIKLFNVAYPPEQAPIEQEAA